MKRTLPFALSGVLFSAPLWASEVENGAFKFGVSLGQEQLEYSDDQVHRTFELDDAARTLALFLETEIPTGFSVRGEFRFSGEFDDSYYTPWWDGHGWIEGEPEDEYWVEAYTNYEISKKSLALKAFYNIQIKERVVVRPSIGIHHNTLNINVDYENFPYPGDYADKIDEFGYSYGFEANYLLEGSLTLGVEVRQQKFDDGESTIAGINLARSF